MGACSSPPPPQPKYPMCPPCSWSISPGSSQSPSSACMQGALIELLGTPLHQPIPQLPSGSPAPHPHPRCSWPELKILAALEGGHQPRHDGRAVWAGSCSSAPMTSAGLPWMGERVAAISASGLTLTCSRRWRTPSSFVLSARSSPMPSLTPKASDDARGMGQGEVV